MDPWRGKQIYSQVNRQTCGKTDEEIYTQTDTQIDKSWHEQRAVWTNTETDGHTL